jgi:hypothetical protein
VHQQVCFCLWDNAPQSGGAPSRPCAVQGWLSWETEELPQHRQPVKHAILGVCSEAGQEEDGPP